ncbi:MAG: transglutaminase family protein [bacterium]|nr:MAG: transglutaminase family protein [bacterium]
MTETSEESLQKYLISTKLIESQHQLIVDKAKELTANAVKLEHKARNIFYFMRDKIRYEFRVKFKEEEYLASYILETGRGFCTQKAILFCALARSCGIPAGIYFYDIIDHSLPAHTVLFMKTRNLYHHGIAALYLNGTWYKYDATLDIQLTKRYNFTPVEFFPDRDCLMSAITLSRSKHIEYTNDYGLHADVSFEEIISWFKRGYPHLVEKYSNS